MIESVQSFAIRYIKYSLIFLMLGVVLGLYMAKTLDYTHRVSHAHLLMLGFIIQMAYGILIKLWLLNAEPITIKRQFWCHQAGTVLTVLGFVLIFGQYLHPAISGIITGIGAFLVIIAAYLMLRQINKAALFIR
ncbi:hypothetical protein [Colwellia sp. MEBiC06753]